MANASTSFLRTASSVLSSIPQLLLGIVISVISSIYFAADYNRIAGYIMRRLPEKGKQMVSQIGLKYVKDYLLLMVITFVEFTLGFLILRLEKAVLIAAVVALLDLLPVLGTGGLHFSRDEGKP